MLIWSRQRLRYLREADGLAEVPVLADPAPVTVWRARELLLAVQDRDGMLRAVRTALSDKGLHVPGGPDQAQALVARAAERIAGGGLRLVMAAPVAAALRFDGEAPDAPRSMAGIVLTASDPERRAQSAVALLAAARVDGALTDLLSAVLEHPSGANWRREVPREAGQAHIAYAAEMMSRRLLLMVPEDGAGSGFRLAWTLEDSRPAAPPAPDAPPPAKPDEPPPPPPAKQVGELSVHVTRPDGTPIEGVEVKVEGLGLEKTDKEGWARYGTVACRGYDASGSKKGFSDTPGGVFRAAEGSGTVSEGAHTIIELVLHPYRIVSITGSAPGTRGRHGKVRPADALLTSTMDELSLAANVPSIVVRGCNTILLTAETSPPEQPVSWSIESNENTDSPPTLTPGPKPWEAKLATGKHGSFSVIGTAGENRVVWNIVFVWVKVDVDSAVVTLTGAHFADDGSGKSDGFDLTLFASGNFDGKATGKYPFQATATVRVVGGGNSKMIGTDQVLVRFLQNGTADSLTGHYSGGGQVLEVPAGPMPILDTNGPVNPVIAGAGMVEVTPNQDAFKRDIWMGDSPAGGFLSQHLNTNTNMTSTSGVNAFSAAIVGVSMQAPHSLVVAAKTDWTAHFTGTVAASTATGPWAWTSNGAKTTGDGAFKLVSPGTGGQDAHAAGFDTFQPRFNNGLTNKWTP